MDLIKVAFRIKVELKKELQTGQWGQWGTVNKLLDRQGTNYGTVKIVFP